MALVEISDVVRTPMNPTQFWGCHLDHPKAGSQNDVYHLDIIGWALGKESPVTAVRILHQDTIIRHANLGERRADVRNSFPDAQHNGPCGFRTAVSTLGLAPQFELKLQLVLANGAILPWAVIRGRQQSLRSNFEPRIQPLLLTTLGRTGSTWLTRLLGQHPRIVTYRPFQCEPRVASYWMDILKDLSEPSSYRLSVTPSDISTRYWWCGDRSNGSSPPIVNINMDAEMSQWLGSESIESLAAFCQGRIEAFYLKAAQIQNQAQPAYFAEKFLPNLATERIWQLYPKAREIILVRDFRDMVCSIFSFSAKLGFAAFGRHRAKSDEEYIHQLRDSASALLQAWLRRSDEAYLLRYEDLIRQPQETLHLVLNYLGIESDEATIQGMLDQALALTPDLQEGHKTSGGSEESIGRWRRDLHPDLRVACEEAFGDALAQFGYSCDAPHLRPVVASSPAKQPSTN
jgi:hypothetical protein